MPPARVLPRLQDQLRGRCIQLAHGQRTAISRLTVEDGARQVALVLGSCMFRQFCRIRGRGGYVSEMQQLTSWCRRWAVWVGVLPLLQQQLGLLDQLLRRGVSSCFNYGWDTHWRFCGWKTHPLLSWLCDVPLGFEKTADVQGLSAPEVSMDAPVEGKLEGAPVEASASRSVAGYGGRRGRAGAQDVYSGAHGDATRCIRIGRQWRVGGLWSQCVSAASQGRFEAVRLAGLCARL